jgi:hypothetical protein
MSIRICSLLQLKYLANNSNGDFSDFHIVLVGGLAASSKRILYHSEFDEFSIISEIDESYQEVSSANLAYETNLILAIKNGCLYRS